MADWTPPEKDKAPSGWTPPAKDVAPEQPQQPPGKQLAPPVPQASTSPLVGGPSAASSTPSGVGLPTSSAEIRMDPMPKLDRFGVEQPQNISREAMIGAFPGFEDREAAQKKKEADYTSAWGGMSMDQVKSIKERDIPLQVRALRGMEQGYLEDQKQLEFAKTELDGLAQTLQQQVAQNPALAQQAQQQYEAAVSDFNQMAQSLNKQGQDIMDRASYIEQQTKHATRREHELKAKQGGFWGATYNNALNSIGSAVSGISAPLFEAVSAIENPINTPESKADEQTRKKDLLDAIRNAPREMAGTEGTTEEYIQKMQEGFWGGAWLGATGSLPVAVMGPAGIGLMAQASDNVRQELEDPTFADIPTWEKEAFAMGVGGVVGWLERLGLTNAARNKGLVNGIVLKAVERMPQNATTQQIKAALRSETESYVANLGLRLVGGSLDEGVTELTQGIAEPGMKMIFNAIEEKNLTPNEDGEKGFDTPDGFSDFFAEAGYAGLQGMVGGAMYGAPRALMTAKKERKLSKLLSLDDYKPLEVILKDPEFANSVKEEHQGMVEAGDMTQVQADEANASWEQSRSVVEKIPDDLDPEKRREAFLLLTEKEELSKLDKNLVGDRIAKIDEKLAALSGQPMPEGMKKPEEVKLEPRSEPAKGPEAPGSVARQAVQEKQREDFSQTFVPKGLTLSGREEDGSLVGLPRKVRIGDSEVRASSFQPAQDVATDYMSAARIPYSPPSTYAKVDKERAARIAKEYDKMKHDPEDPAVKASYEALTRETMAQWDAMMRSGLNVEFMRPNEDGTINDPYAGNPRMATEDVRNNNHLWVFPTSAGFGSSSMPDNHPMLKDSGAMIGGEKALVNDIFRAVHDYFGHVKEGVGFRADGEENAWRVHASMYSPEARGAMTTETRGQNSWVNYGPYGDKNRAASGEDTVYADQKAGLLPDWVSEEGRHDDGMISVDGVLRQKKNSSDRPIAPTDQGIVDFWRWFGNSAAVDSSGRPLVLFHGTTSEFDAPTPRRGEASSRIGAPEAIFFSSSPDIASGFTMMRGVVLKRGGRVIPAYLRMIDPAIIDANGGGISSVIGGVKNGVPTIIKNVQDSSWSGPIADTYIVPRGEDVLPVFGDIPQDQVTTANEQLEAEQVSERGGEVTEAAAVAQEATAPAPIAEGSAAIEEVGTPNAIETLSEPKTLHRGQDGKRTAEGERINEHKGVNGLFASESLEAAQKYGRKTGAKSIELPAGTTVETIEINGDLDEAFRKREVDAINASKADVVKLVTVDGDKSGKQVQYVLKNKDLWPPRREKIEEPPVIPPSEPTAPEVTDDSWKQRNTHGPAKWLKKNAPAIYKALDKNRRRDIEYEVFPNKVSLEAARNVVGYLGLENAVDAAFDPSNRLPMAVRTMIMGVAVTELEKAGEIDRAAKLWADAMDYGTDIGQGAQAFNRIKGMYSPSIMLNEAARVVNEAMKQVPAEARARAEHIYNTLTDQQRQVVEQILLKQSSQAKVNKAAANKPYSAGGSSISFGKEVRQALEKAKKKTVTREAAEKAWKELGSMMNSGVPPQMVTIAVYLIERGARSFAEVAKVVTKRLGKKALPYLKAAYAEANKQLGINDEFVTSPEEIDEYIAKQNTDSELKRFEKAIKAGKDAEAAKAIAALQQVARDMGVWGAYREQAAQRLNRMAERTIAEDRTENPPVGEFTQGLIRNMVSQMREEAMEKGKEESEVKRPSDIKVIGEAYKNPEKYKEVWQKTQNEFRAKLNAAKARLAKAETPEAKEEAKRAIEREHSKLEKLDAYYGDLMPKPFSDALLGRAIKDGLKAENIKINDIIRQHYSVPEAAKRTLQQKLVQDAGLTEERGQDLADSIGREFNRMMDERKAAAQEQFVKRKTTKRTAKEKRIEDEAILLTNTGALSKEEFLQKYAEIMDWPRFTKEDADDIIRLSNRVQEAPEGRPRNEAISDLLGKMADLKGVSKWDITTAIWYSHLLSGLSTQGVNAVANTWRLGAEMAVAMANSPKDARGLIQSMVYGFAKGAQEFRSTLVTGYSPVRGKVEAAALLERHKFKGPLRILNNHKYIQRVMRAVDTLFYESLREMRAYQIAAAEARDMYPSESVRKKALDLMNINNQSIVQAQEQAKAEYDKEMARIAESDLAGREKVGAEKKAARDRKRREFELVELGRPQDMLERSANFALASTYNDPPKGTLGALARGINQITREVPGMRAIAPFVNVVANVLSDAVNYTPAGAIRSLAGGSIGGGLAKRMGLSDRIERDFENMSLQERSDLRADLLAKAEIGLLLFAALMVASEPGDDDEPLIEVTGSGFGSYGKNEVLRKSGWREKSIRIGDRYYSYEYTPFVLLLSAIGNYRDSQKYRKDDSEKNDLERMTAAMSRVTPSILDMSFLSDSEKLLSGLANPEGDNKLEDLLASSVKSAKRLVIPALYDEAARSVEAAFNSPLKDVRRSIFGNFLKDIPGVRDNYPVRYDALGDPVMPESRWFRRFQSPADDSDPVVNLLIDKQYQLRLPPVTKPIYDPDLGEDRQMTETERETYYRVRGQSIRDQVTENMDWLIDLTPKEFAQEMTIIQRDATLEASDAVMGYE